MTSLLARILNRLPLGWLQLISNRTRLLSAVAGVTFANILIFMQLGFLGAITETSTLMHQSWDADLVVASSDYKSFREASSIPRSRILQSLQTEGVEDVSTFFVDNIPWTNPETGNAMIFRAMGVEPYKKVYIDPEIQRLVPLLTEPSTALIDSRSRGMDPAFYQEIEEKGFVEIEIAGRNLKFVGTFALGASFDVDGSIIVSQDTYLGYFSNQSTNTPIFGFIDMEPGADPDAIASAINANFPEDDVIVRTRAEFIQAEQDYQQKVTPVGFVFSFGVIMGFVVGLVIVYQILTTDVQDHLAEYATFKAMGYRQKYFLSVIFEEATSLATLGFIPGFLVSLGLYHLASTMMSMPIEMPPGRILFVFFLTLTMCGVSGAIATRRLANAQPADLF